MATQEQRKLMAQVEELGYTYKGHGQNNDIIMHHPDAGALRIHATTSDHRAERNTLTEARRRLRAGQARYGGFVSALMDRYDVGADDQRELQLNMREEAKRYVHAHPEAGRMESLVAQVERDPRLEVLERKQGKKEWLVRLTGPDYALREIEPDAPESPEEERPMPLAANNHQPMETIIESLREMMVAEMSGELDDLRAKHDLTVETLSSLLDQLKSTEVTVGRR